MACWASAEVRIWGLRDLNLNPAVPIWLGPALSVLFASLLVTEDRNASAMDAALAASRLKFGLTLPPARSMVLEITALTELPSIGPPAA